MSEFDDKALVIIGPEVLPPPQMDFNADGASCLIDDTVDGLAAFHLKPDGLYWKVNELFVQKISGPIIAIAKTVDLARPDTRGLLLWLKNLDQRDVVLHIARNAIMQPKTLIANLLDRDFYLNPQYRRELVLYLSKMSPKETRYYVGQTGWAQDYHAFVTPSTPALQRPGAQPLFFFQPQSSRLLRAFRRSGDLAIWQQQVAALCHGNPLPIFALATAFAGPLLGPLNMDSFCVHIYGTTSRGKTTTTQFAATVWGNGADPTRQPDDTFLNRWSTTKRALDRTAALVNDTLLVMDEIGSDENADFANTIYNFLGGTSKAGLQSNLAHRPEQHWRIVALSSGELSGRAKIEQKQPALGGQLNRFIDIPGGENLFPATGDRTGDDFVEHGKQVCARYFGSAGPEFMAGLIEHNDPYALVTQLIPRFDQHLRTLRDEVASLTTLTPEQVRVLRRFALIRTAGELAVKAKCLPFTENEVNEAVRFAVTAWLTDAETLGDGERMVAAVQAYLTKHQSSFIDVSLKTLPANRKVIGYRKPPYFLLTDETFTLACGGFESRRVAAELRRRDYLPVQTEVVKGAEKTRFKVRAKVPTVGGKQIQRFYHIKDAILSL